MALSCHRKIFTELLEADGLLVMGPGLGLPQVVAKFLRLYSSSPKLVLVVNAAGDERLLREVLEADGVAPDALPVVIDAELPAPERKLLYARGGCVFVTSRIVVVDLLNGRIERGCAAGILLLHTHRVWEDSLEAWAVQLFAEQNPSGFVKAFSDDPEALTSGFDRLGKVMRAARVPKLYLWPRFQVHMAQDLSRSAPEVVELAAPLTPLMVTVQRAVMECLDGCLDELRRCAHVDVAELTRENGLFERFDVTVRRQLQPVWNTLKAHTKHVVAGESPATAAQRAGERASPRACQPAPPRPARPAQTPGLPPPIRRTHILRLPRQASLRRAAGCRRVAVWRRGQFRRRRGSGPDQGVPIFRAVPFGMAPD